MPVTRKPLFALTAEDLMTREVVRLPEDMPLRDSARLLMHHQVSGAPVVDAHGRCVGVLSAIDVLRLAGKNADFTRPAAAASVTCPFQTRYRRPDGKELTLCTLPPGVCPIQVKETGAGGEQLFVCGDPHCVWADWQVLDFGDLPDEEVRRYMTPDPVTVPPDTPVRALARTLIDAHILRVIVVEEERKPVGVVSSTDLLAALAYCDGDE
jgi:CBS domain-containing protein